MLVAASITTSGKRCDRPGPRRAWPPKAEVRRDNPLAWLRYGPGRERPGEPGWTESREILGQDGGPVKITLDLGGSRQLEAHQAERQLEAPEEESNDN